MMDRGNGHVVSFLSLEDFARDVIAVDDLVRVDAMERLVPGDHQIEYLQWWVVATAITVDGMAMVSFRMGHAPAVFRREVGHFVANARAAATLVTGYLAGRGFAVAPGMWNLGAVVTNLVQASAGDLWRFEGQELVANV